MTEDASIKATDDGPLIIKGSFAVVDGEGARYETDKAIVALCRCGRSESKPFCDGSHKRVGFQSKPRVPTADGARAIAG